MTTIVSEQLTMAADGVEIRPAVLTSDDIKAIKAEVSVDHEVLRRTGIRNLEKKFGSVARVASAPSVLSIAASFLGATVCALFQVRIGSAFWRRMKLITPWHQQCLKPA